jgi:glycopeptide antibiotics resistance protein
MPRRWRLPPSWVLWIPVVWLVSFPWSAMPADPAASGGAHWIPFTDPADKPRDFILNTLLFVPFGYSFARWRRAWPLLATVAAAAAVSLSAEALQILGTNRYPSGTDVVAAMTGALAGGLAVRLTGVASKN